MPWLFGPSGVNSTVMMKLEPWRMLVQPSTGSRFSTVMTLKTPSGPAPPWIGMRSPPRKVTAKDQVAAVAKAIEQLDLEVTDSGAEQAGMLITVFVLVFSLLSTIIVGIAAVNIMHVFFMLVYERQREIGIMRAVGASRGDIRLIILGEAASVGLAAGTVGVLLAYAASLGFDAVSANYVPDFPYKPTTYFLFTWDLVALALACDLVRVFSVMFSTAGSGVVVWQAGAKNGLHQICHDEAVPQPTVHAAVVLTMKQLAYFLGRLRDTPDGDGNLLDRSAILCTTELSEGNMHSNDEFPILLAGRANGKLKGGLHVRSTTKDNASKALLTVLRAAGAPLAEYGTDGGKVSSTIAAVEG